MGTSFEEATILVKNILTRPLAAHLSDDCSNHSFSLSVRESEMFIGRLESCREIVGECICKDYAEKVWADLHRFVHGRF